ncbi:MAG: T9SS type A sorting domain-containing protein [Bacteroidales bacterium]
MKKNLLIIVALVILPFVKLSAQCAQSSNIYTFTYGGHTYEVVKELKNWTNAAACAVERGGYLVEINDQAEQTYIYNQIQAAGVSSTYTQVMDGGGTAYIWIGANDKFTEGSWKWDGTNTNTGTSFWNGQGAAGVGGGSAVNNAFINWGGKSTGTINEPDDYGNQQDAAAIALSGWPLGTTMLGIGGEWNDIALSNSIFFIIEKNNSGLNEINKVNEIELYPNPSKDIIQLKNIDDKNATIQILNIEGKVIKQILFSELSIGKININNLPKGVYFVKVNDRNRILVNKFVKE